MARLSEHEKDQLTSAAARKSPAQPPVPKLSAEEFLEFATLASQLAPVPKPVSFTGDNWKL